MILNSSQDIKFEVQVLIILDVKYPPISKFNDPY